MLLINLSGAGFVEYYPKIFHFSLGVQAEMQCGSVPSSFRCRLRRGSSDSKYFGDLLFCFSHACLPHNGEEKVNMSIKHVKHSNCMH